MSRLACVVWGLGAAILLLPGCRHPASKINVAQVTGPKLSTKAVAYIAIPSDVFYKKELAVDSGRQTATVVRDTFAKYLRQAYIGRHVETFVEALETGRTHRCTYLVYLTVLKWEDHATEFTGVRDKVQIKIQVADVPSGDVLHSTILEAVGPWMTSGGATPGDILREPVGKYVASLFQVIHTPTALPRTP